MAEETKVNRRRGAVDWFKLLAPSLLGAGAGALMGGGVRGAALGAGTAAMGFEKGKLDEESRVAEAEARARRAKQQTFLQAIGAAGDDPDTIDKLRAGLDDPTLSDAFGTKAAGLRSAKRDTFRLGALGKGVEALGKEKTPVGIEGTARSAIESYPTSTEAPQGQAIGDFLKLRRAAEGREAELDMPAKRFQEDSEKSTYETTEGGVTRQVSKGIPKPEKPPGDDWTYDSMRGAWTKKPTDAGSSVVVPEGLPARPQPAKKPFVISPSAAKDIRLFEDLKDRAIQLKTMLEDPAAAPVLEQYMGGTAGKVLRRATAVTGGMGTASNAANTVLGPLGVPIHDQPPEVTTFERNRKDLMDFFGRVRTGANMPATEVAAFEEIISGVGNTPQVAAIKLQELLDRSDKNIELIKRYALPMESQGGVAESDFGELEQRAKAGDAAALDELEKAAESSDEALEAYERAVTGR